MNAKKTEPDRGLVKTEPDSRLCTLIPVYVRRIHVSPIVACAR